MWETSHLFLECDDETVLAGEPQHAGTFLCLHSSMLCFNTPPAKQPSLLIRYMPDHRGHIYAETGTFAQHETLRYARSDQGVGEAA